MSSTNGPPELDVVVATLAELHATGSPVVGSDDVLFLARVALRRWSSFDRRSPRHRDDLERRVEDLAKGLRDSLESDRRVVGPLMTDYRHTARSIATALVRDQDDARSASDR